MNAFDNAADRRRLQFLDGGGETGALIRARDWGSTPLGPPDSWPQSLRSALSICLNSSFPTAIYWGPELHLLYNDAWAPVPAERHPGALGRPGAEVWPDIWDIVGPQFARVMETGEGFSTFDQMLPMVRGGVRRETYWNYSFTPIRGEDGRVAGIFNQGHETTARVFGARRADFLLQLTDRLRSLSDPREVIETAEAMLGGVLSANRVGYGAVDETGRRFTTDRNWTDGRVPAREGTYDLGDFGPAVLASLNEGVPLLIGDAASDPRTSAPEILAAFEAIEARAVITVALQKGGRTRAALYVHACEPRSWSEADAELVADVAERTWSAVERAEVEARLRESEGRFRALVSAGSYAVFRMSPDWSVLLSLEGNGFLADATEPRRDWLQSYIGSDHRADALEAVREAVATCGVFQHEHPVRRADGGAGWVFSRAVPIQDADGRIVEWFGVATDVTARREAETALRASEARLSAVVESLPIGVGVAGLDGRIILSNPELRRFLPTAVIPSREPGRPSRWQAFDAEGRPVAPHDFPGARAIRGERVVPGLDMLFTDDDGRETWTNVATVPIRDGSGAVVGQVVAISDVDKIKRAADALRASEARLIELNETLEQRIEEALAERKVFADLVERTDALVKVVDFDYRILAINRASADEFERMHGIRPKVGDNVLELVAAQPDQHEEIAILWARALAGEEFTETREVVEPDGERRVHEMKYSSLRGADGQRIGAYRFVYDVTERTRDQARLAEAEAQLRQAQKMDAVGQLTGGVAHDFNNLLTIIKGSADFLRRPGLSPERQKRYVEAISETVDRASKLTGQLLAFARRQALKPEVFDAAERLRAVADMLSTVVGGRIRIVSQIACEHCFVEADVSQFETALVNMVVNARDAMQGEGVLTIAVERVAGMPGADREAGTPGRFVAVSIADTGSGIPPERLDQVFEPFYTTKEVGKGTGLGLSQVYGFAKQSRGDVTVESEPGIGTRFTLYLPRIEQAGAPDRQENATPGDEPSEHGRGKRVLVVEDNMEVGGFSTQVLQDLGYETVWARNADEALALLAGPEAFDVVFSDVVMPGMSGVELGREVRRRHPGLPVVLTSGYSQVLAEDGRHGFELIHKPYAAEDLSRVLRRIGRPKPA